MKKTKMALLHSVIALVLCFSMLVGTTFAWFTDEVSSGKNQIVAGNLDIELYWTATPEDPDSWKRVDEKTNIFKDNTLWEPGHTEVVYLKIVNEGTLALKYQLGINVAGETGSVNVLGEDFKLSQYIRYGVEAGQKLFANRDAAVEAVDATATALNQAYASDVAKLESKGEQVVTLVVYMPTSVGNEANHAKDRAVPTINLGIRLQATQVAGEMDSFGDNYDAGATFPEIKGGDVILQVTTENGLTTAAFRESADGLTLAVPAGVKTTGNTLSLTVDEMATSGANITVFGDQMIRPLDVHVAGVAGDNTQPMTVTIEKALMPGLNLGNYKLFHVEANGTNEMTLVAADAAFDAHNQFKYDPATGDVVLYMATFSEVALVAEPAKWAGNFDYTWYDASKTELTIANADQLAAFGAIVGGMNGQTQDSFAGKIVKLVADINLGDKESENNPDIIFYPIGYYNSEGTYERTNTAITSGLRNFEGTFDGNGHTVSNFYHNTWEMKGDHDWYSPEEQYYRDGMGLFGRVYKGTVKNLTVKNFSSDGEIATTGVIAAYADGATFENIAIFDCNPRVYNIGNGGIVGCVGWYAKEADLETTFKNITVDNSNKISALWGSYDVACGGIVGQYYPTSGQTSANKPANAGIHFENCHISAVMDVYNDVCANYQYYAYRYTGMLIGSVRENVTVDGHSYPMMDGITAKDCTVHFGTWNDYYYCEIIDNTTASYTHDYQMSRLEQVADVDDKEMKYLPLGKADVAENWVAIPTSGRVNYVVVNGKHATENATCYHFKNGAVWNHADAGYHDGKNGEKFIDENGDGVADLKEDKQHIYLEFNNLVTGYGWGVTTKGVGDLAGVTILDREVANSVEKFEGKVTELANNKEYKLGDIFKFVDKGVELVPGALAVGVTNLSENNSVSATIVYDRTNWENSTITFTGAGKVNITIQDYYFCTPTTITIEVKDRQPEVKFATKFTNTNFTYRVGNENTVELGNLFAAKEDAQIGNVDVNIANVSGNASGTYKSNSSWTKGTIQFSGTGKVKVTITDNAYCTPTELYLEVVDAVNATGAMSATTNNVVLLQDAGFSSLEVSGGYTLYGNGFTLTCGSDSPALDTGYSFVTLDNGILDNVQIVTPNFDYAVLYKSNMTESGNRSQTTDRTRYYNVKSGVMVSGNSQILNSRISGARAAVNVTGGNCLIDNSRIELGAVASLLVGSANSLTLRDVTLVQKPTASTYKDANGNSKTLMGFSALYMCDSAGKATPTTLEGTLVQQAWVNADDKQYVPSAGQDIVDGVMKETDYIHNINNKDSLNLGFAYMPEDTSSTVNAPDNITDKRTDKATVPYEMKAVSIRIAILNTTVYVYSYKNTNGTADSFKTESDYVPNKYGDIITVNYSDTADGLESGKSFGTDGWVYELNVDLDKASGYKLDFSKLSMSVNGTAVTDFKVNGNAKPSTPVAVTAGGVTYTLTATVNGKEYTATYKVTGTETSKESPSKISGPTAAGFGVAKSYGGDWSGAADVLTGVKVKYWSVAENKYIEFDFSNFTVPGNAGKLNGTNNYWEYTHTNNDFTLKVTNSSAIHSGKSVYGMPIRGTDGKLYFTISSTNGYVGSGTTSRSIAMKYEFTDNNGGEKLTFTHTFNISYNKDEQYSYSDLSDSGKLTKLEDEGCLVEGTLITLADGTQKAVEDLKIGDMLMVFNHVSGKYEAMPLIFNTHSDVNEAENYDILYLQFSDGRELKIVQSHGLFDMTLMKYVYITTDNYQDYIGHEFYALNSDGTSGQNIELVKALIKNEKVRIFCPVTYFHMNSFANGLLNTPNIPGDITGLVNYFEYDSDLKYNEEAMQRDIEKYGLYTYDDFSEYISEEAYNSSPSVYLKVAVGKGMITYEQIIDIILWLLEGSLIDN